MKKIAIISSLLFLFSCSNIKENNIVERKISKTHIQNKSNSDILNNNELSKKIFDKQNRKINKNLKAVWVATVNNLDFPNNKDNAELQKKEIDNIVKNAKSWGLNAIFLQVKPTDSVLYNSKKLPWSIYLTGTEDKYPNYDPLEYFITKAHENGLELHAWINPYRVSMNNDYSKLSEKSVAKKHPDWVFEYGGKLYLNPAKKEVVEYLYNAIEEIVMNYNIDGVHLDDYFYPYPISGKKMPDFDKVEFENSGYSNIADFRRENVNNLIKNLSVSIHKIKPTISFGVSPFGIWRNIKNDTRGSKTNGLSTYDDLYADVIKWMEKSWVDYVAPQIYWPIGHNKADYEILIKWWNDKARETNTVLYIGEGLYKADKWDNYELRKHKELRKSLDNVKGYILFRYKNIEDNLWMIDESR